MHLQKIKGPDLDLRQFLSDKGYRYEQMGRTLKASIARQVRALRRGDGLTRAQLAEKLGTVVGRVSILENPHRKDWPRISTLLKVASVFDVALLIKFVTMGRFIQEMVITPDEVLIRASDEILQLAEWAAKDEQPTPSNT